MNHNEQSHNRRLRVLHVVPSYYPAVYWGGPIFSTMGICDALAASAEVELTVLTTDSAGPRRDQRLDVGNEPILFPSGYSVHYCRRTLGHTFVPMMLLRVELLVKCSDIIHLTGVYSPPTLPTLLACKLYKKPLVWSPRGSFMTWTGSTNLFAKQIWLTACRLLLRRSKTRLHATSAEEYTANRHALPGIKGFVAPKERLNK